MKVPVHALLAAMALAAAWLAPVYDARADAIDGMWCKGSRSMQIDGPAIVTPGGTSMTGDYARHGFRYVVPADEEGAGKDGQHDFARRVRSRRNRWGGAHRTLAALQADQLIGARAANGKRLGAPAEIRLAFRLSGAILKTVRRDVTVLPVERYDDDPVNSRPADRAGDRCFRAPHRRHDRPGFLRPCRGYPCPRTAARDRRDGL